MTTSISSMWNRVNKDGPLLIKELGKCWAWTGSKNAAGRGQVEKDGKYFTVPRVIYEQLVSPIPLGMRVLHKCDNPNCVNPSHLFLGSQLDNVHDMLSKGRAKPPRGSKHCRAKLTVSQVAMVRRRHRRWCPFNGTAALARELGVDSQIIQKIVNNRSYIQDSITGARG